MEKSCFLKTPWCPQTGLVNKTENISDFFFSIAKQMAKHIIAVFSQGNQNVKRLARLKLNTQ